MNRNISYVLFADIKGYSRLSDVQLETFHEKVLPKLANRLADHGWTYSNTWGDALVLASQSARAIANQALEFRDFFAVYDWLDDGLPPLDVRISIHCGEHLEGSDPFTRSGQIVGATVILAARIEPITLPGQVWTTQAAALAIRAVDQGGTPRFGLDEIGEVALPKDFGATNLFLLRRAAEQKVAPDAVERIVAENSRRQQVGRTIASEHEKSSFTVAVGVVVKGDQVVIVRRRKNGEGLTWMFPSGAVLPLQDPEYRVWREVKAETGLSCSAIRRIDARPHPKTGQICEYFLLEPARDGVLVNGDPHENDDVQWVHKSEAAKYIGPDLFEAVKRVLEA